MTVRTRVRGIPAWMDVARLSGFGGWVAREDAWEAQLSRDDAARVMARMRGLILGGLTVETEVFPKLNRKKVRAARTEDARDRRQTSPGFTRPGTRLDDEGHRSLTPERLALELGQLAAELGHTHVVDACCGAGGNAIGFARAGLNVLAVELDPHRAALARHNARAYGVKIDVVVGDALEHANTPHLLFVDPPWTSAPQPVIDPTRLALVPELRSHPNVWFKLPASADPSLLPGFQPTAWYGHAPGDHHRVKFALLQGQAEAANPHSD